MQFLTDMADLTQFGLPAEIGGHICHCARYWSVVGEGFDAGVGGTGQPQLAAALFQRFFVPACGDGLR